jgi:hypothetical protein
MKVRLEITDMMGVVLMRPIDKQQSAGQYEINLDCTSLPSGNYLYKLSAGNMVQVKKLVIIK